MTPERKEEIKRFYELYKKNPYELEIFKDPVVIRAYVHISELLVALEEAERQSAKWEKAFDNADRQYLKQEKAAADLRRQLEEAQHRIGDLETGLRVSERTGMKWYDELTEASNEAMRYEEEARTWEDRHSELYRAYADQDRLLAEAQQTIARQREALEDIKFQAGITGDTVLFYELACEALGEGAKES